MERGQSSNAFAPVGKKNLENASSSRLAKPFTDLIHNTKMDIILMGIGYCRNVICDIW